MIQLVISFTFFEESYAKYMFLGRFLLNIFYKLDDQKKLK